ncbi:MAG: hypothetical protein HOM03_06835 [Marinovum sp.]|nr:hypothetical protein [Marinovum sp.]
MGIENKILTVSYGTFSCTLEGFTDSFDAIKAIAEYFRDLASDDRYFAANPPDLDPGIISELASLNSSQKLTARTQGTNVVLSPAEPKTTEPSNFSPTAPFQDTTLTERVERIRALVNQGTISDDENEQTKIWPANNIIQADPVENFFADNQEAGPATQEKPAPQPAPLSLEISAGEQTRAASELSAKTSEQTREVQAENQNPMDLASTSTNQKPLEIIFDDFTFEPNNSSDQNEPIKKDEPIKEASKNLANPAPIPDAADLPETRAPEKAGETAQSTAPKLEPTAIPSSGAPQKPAITLPDTPTPLPVKPLVKVVRKPVLTEKEPSSEAPKLLPDEANSRARQIENQSKSAKNTARSSEAIKPLAAVQKPTQKDALKDSFEDNLTEMLSLNSSGAEEEKQKKAEETQPAQPRRQVLRQEHQDVSRLLKQTDQKMAQPDQSRRRNALAHLRAAVAANRGELPTDPEMTDILKIATSTNSASKTFPSQEVPPKENNTSPAPKPLRLVENQRVDAPDVAAADTSQNTPIETPIDFATYAQRVEATTLEAQIEAAASYLSLILRRDTFFRRNVFSRTRQVSEHPFVRRTYMGIFSSLIEQGKVKNLEDGTYEICKDKVGYQLPDQILH